MMNVESGRVDRRTAKSINQIEGRGVVCEICGRRDTVLEPCYNLRRSENKGRSYGSLQEGYHCDNRWYETDGEPNCDTMGCIDEDGEG